VTGSNASGKGAVCRFLATLGFAVHSLSDVIREEAARRNLPPEREHLIRLGNEMREIGGPAVLATGILEELGERTVIDSIRNPAEVAVLRRLPRFVLLGVRAPAELRFARSIRRARPGDSKTLEDFKAREEQENSSDLSAQQLDATFALADHYVDNDGDLDQLDRKIRRLLDEIGVGARV
jgi:dephospho-CoA kinase